MEEVFPKTRYILAQPDETGTGSKLHACQCPAAPAVTGVGPFAPGVNDDCQGVHINVVRTDPANGTTVSKTIPLDDVEKWKSEGWNIWYYPSRPCNKDKNGVDPRPISAPEDIIHQDKPHRDTMKLFHTGSSFDDLSFESRGDNKANAGRQITKDMIPKKNWNLGREPVTLWCPENPTSTIYLPPMNESSQNAAGGEEEIETATKRSLWDRFNPSEAHLSRFQSIGYGLGGQVPLGGRGGRGGRGSGFISRFG
ncbi:hypothetical protein PFICI_13653 [Pestalotiopsis fici W106-1]|uniref:Uncharacterized protein n=1 Tax=Pestalotiopsis fici (strain W106-1 / CGMCC3.15140) TaxID=1229662 RepID=W3WN08_PESFW|nr:uncharacterized protein PFICI_13653 [Pestalotiopsis fici W106-1]ETS75169.1 hypothetical protein PFICI_13653 [Pestalotiopsis fici W106-1]